MHGCGEKQGERGEGKACKGATTIKEEKANIVLKIRTSFSFFSSHFETELKKKQPLYNTVLLSFFSTQKNFQRILKPR